MHKILILGAGSVGRAIGLGWLARGHDVRFGVPDPANPKYADLPEGTAQPATERHGADIIVVATPWRAAHDALAALGPLNGAIVIDCTNPLGMGANGLELVVGHDNSGAEQLAAAFPAARIVKTLNQTGAENMADAGAYHPRPMMFAAADDQAAKQVAMSLVAELGFVAIDAGPLRAARLLEPLAMLWIELALKRGHARDFAFAMVRHPRSPQA